MEEKIYISDLTLPEVKAYLAEIGEKPFRASQLYEWLHVKNADTYDAMTNLPKSLRDRLAEERPIRPMTLEEVRESAIDGTRKYLFKLADGQLIESVLMRYHHGNSVCISSQVGCRMGCRFCASTLGGLIRSLSSGEMLGQVYAIERDTGERVSNVVIMGMGEPLDNYEAVVRFLRMISDEKGHHISERNLTLSTCGLVPGIRRLAEEKLMINLALSLHAPNDELRKEIMPIARAYKLDDIFAALRDYYEANHRRLTFEYSLIAGVNDTDACAKQLSSRVRGMNCLINLIPVNPVRENEYKAPQGLHVAAFKKKLENYGINVTIRREMGRDIEGACGQLRKRYTETVHV